jgi:hypothetical protein
MLKFRVEGQKLTWENPDEVVVAGTKKYLECYFEFDGDAWSGFENIEVFFKNGRDKPVRMLLSANRIWKEDRLCLSAGDWSVYLRAMVSKKKLDEEGNVIYEEDGVTPVMELDKQITSSTVSIRVLAHGQFENAQNSFESPEIAEQYIAQMLDIGNAMSVFEEYNPEKEYVKHNKVTFEGSSYVLMSERAQGVNPTDDGVWLLITERGKDGTRIFEFPFKDYNPEVGETHQFGSIQGFEDYYGQTFPGIDSWRVGDYFLSEEGKMLIIEGMVKTDGVVRFITVRCLADIKGKDGKNGEKGTTIHTVNFGLSKVNPVGVRYSNYWRGEGMYLDFTMPKGFVEGDLLFDGGSGLMFNHSTARYSTTEHGETIMVTYDVITVIANLNGKDAVVDQELDWDSENAIANKTVAMKVNEIRSVMSAIEGTSARTDFSNVSNEDFRAKAEEAGVGGDDAGLADEKNYMVFKGVVSELPETANDGEVYKQAGGLQLGDYIGYAWEMYEAEQFWIYPDRIDTFNWQATENMNTAWYQSENEEKPILFVFELMTDDGRTLHYTIEAEEFSMEGEASCIMYGQTSVTESETLFGGIVSIRKGTLAEEKTCVYHNGEWVEL